MLEHKGKFNSREYDKFERMELTYSPVRDAIHELKTYSLETLAQHREAISDIDKKLIEAVDAMLDGKITIDDKNRYSEALEQKRQDLRREIDKLERNQGLNEATIDYVCNFMTKPAKLWKDADLETRQAFQKMLFPNGLHFDIKDKIFGTDDLSPLFSVINNKKEPDSGSDCEMVISAGVEPALSG